MKMIPLKLWQLFVPFFENKKEFAYSDNFQSLSDVQCFAHASSYMLPWTDAVSVYLHMVEVN